MAILTNPFVDVVNAMNGFNIKYVDKPTPELRRIYQARRMSLEIALQRVIKQATALLAPDEKIINLLPMTNEDNSAAATDGVMGMYAPHTQAARNYIKSQDNLRGNRLMIFTNQRIIFFIVVEFIDDPSAYFSYRYENLQHIKLKKHKTSVPKGSEYSHVFTGREYSYWYTFDFETADGHIFTEILTRRNAWLVKKNLLEIPGMQHIDVSDKVVRHQLLNMLLGNVNMQLTIFQWQFWVMLVVVVLIVLFIYVLPYIF